MINNEVDEEYLKTLRRLLSIAGFTKIPLPSTALEFLNMYPQFGLEQTLDRIREEFKEFKQKIVEWEHIVRTHSSSTADDLKVIKKVNESISSLSPSNPMDIAVSVAPAVAGEFLNQSISWTSFAGLTEKSIELFRKWLRRRNITFFVNAKKEAMEITNQEDLVKLAFGSTLPRHNVIKFLRLTQTLDNLYDINSNTPRQS